MVVIVRHAHAAHGARDHERSLSAVGVEQARRLASSLAAALTTALAARPQDDTSLTLTDSLEERRSVRQPHTGQKPDIALWASTARRTQETAQAIADLFDIDVLTDSRLYLGDDEDIMRCLDTIASPIVMTVAHAPSVAWAAMRVIVDQSGGGDEEDRHRIATTGCPTATAYLIERDVDTGEARLLDILITPEYPA